MISLPTKQTDKVDLFAPLLRNMQESCGPQLSGQAKLVLERLQLLRNELTDLSTIRSNPSATRQIIEALKEYLNIWNCIIRSFIFGNDKESINVYFTWYDAYSKEKRTSANPIAERVGMLYNLGILYSQAGTDLAILPGDKVKEAAGLFLTAAWIFDRLKLDLVNLQLKELSPDVSVENLSMCFFLMKAQAQSCAYERVLHAKPDRYDLLARLAMQACKEYEVANGYSKGVGVAKAANGKNIITIMQYKEAVFRSRAFYWSAMNQKRTCEESVTGMGKAVASIRKAMEILDSLKKVEKSFTPEIMNEYKTFYAQCADLQRITESLNNKLYHESIPTRPVEIDGMLYGQPISIEGELDRPFEGKEIFSLKVPQGVRALDNEYKKEVGVIIQETFELARQIEEYQVQMLRKYNLPSAIHAVSSEQKIPEDMWQRIRKCKENGGANSLNQIINGVEELAKCNGTNIMNIYTQLKEEEKEDQAMKQKYGSKWSRLPSANLNVNMAKQLKNYKQKFDEGRQSDIALKELIATMKEQFGLLELDRDSLTKKIPKSKFVAGGLSPAATK